MAEVIEALSKMGLLKKNQPNRKLINSIPAKRIFDIADELTETMGNINTPTDPSIYTHSISGRLSGAIECCSDLNCRLSKIEMMLRFALLYSDKVYIQNYFAFYRNITKMPEEYLRESFYNDIFIVNKIKPLIKKGLVNFYSINHDLCLACNAASVIGEDKKNIFNREFNRIKKVTIQRNQKKVINIEENA